MTKKCLLPFLMLFLHIAVMAQSIETDPMVGGLQKELQYNFSQLKKQQPAGAYFMSLRMADEFVVNITSDFGVSSINEQHERTVTPQVRLGSMEFDNFKYVNQGTSDPNGRNARGINVPLNGKPLQAIREAIWQETLKRFRIAQTNYNNAKSRSMTSAENEDKAPCFSAAPVEKYYQQELPASAYNVDKKGWAEKLNAVTKVFKEDGKLESGNATITFTIIRTWYVNSEGTVTVQNRQTVRVMLSASIKAVDGMSCPLFQDFFGYTDDQLPDLNVLTETARDMTKRLHALANAPIVDPYTGPAILSGPASGVFFHEIFGHRLEGHRLKTGGETFKKKVNERVLPESFNVYCDPTLSTYAGTILNGHYVYDDEGVKARRVDNVVNGVLKNFLMSRVPIDGFPQSNGHGRTRGGNDPVSRQSNLIVETTKPYTEAQLRKMLIEEAKRQGKEFGYYFRTVTSGYTLTGEGNSLNSFNVSPIEVYRVFVDGRKDQLVRGVDLIGTPLSMFSNIVAAGDKPSTFTGECGAESGWVPVTATSPMIFVSQVETQRSKAQRQVPYVLPQPDQQIAKGQQQDETIIFKAMEDEMKRSEKMTFADMPIPYLVDYRIARIKQSTIVSSLGGTMWQSDRPISTVGAANITLGDKMLNSGYGSVVPMKLSNEVNYDEIRRQLWLASDNMYKYAINTLASKQNYLTQRPLSAKEALIAETFSAPAKEYIAPTVLDKEYNNKEIQALADKLSAVFCDFPKLYNSNVVISTLAGDAYRLTSEGVRVRQPIGYTMLLATASVKAADGSVIQDKWEYDIDINAPLPDTDKMINDLRKFATRLTEEANAEVLTEYYTGPIMYEDEASSSSFANSILSPILMASRNLQYGSGKNSMMFGKRIIDTKINIEQCNNLKEYNGIKLIGNYDADADGRTPEQVTMVQNGMLRRILTGRIPAISCEEPSGNERFTDELNRGLTTGSAFGNVRIYGSKTRPAAKMRDRLANEAKKAGLDYAFIVKSNNSGNLTLYRFDVKTGKETLVRSKTIPLAKKSDMMHITDISREEIIDNTIMNEVRTSIIAPQSFIVESMEFNFEAPQSEPPFAIEQPK